jgi:hypothetical protein
VVFTQTSDLKFSCFGRRLDDGTALLIGQLEPAWHAQLAGRPIVQNAVHGHLDVLAHHVNHIHRLLSAMVFAPFATVP